MKKKISTLSYFIFSLLINSQIFASDPLNDALDAYGSTVHASFQCCYESVVCVGECAHFCANELARDKTPCKDKIAKGIIGATIAIVLGLGGYSYFTKDQSDKVLERYQFDKGFQDVMHACTTHDPHDHTIHGMAQGMQECAALRSSKHQSQTAPKKKKMNFQRKNYTCEYLFANRNQCFNKRFRNNGRKK